MGARDRTSASCYRPPHSRARRAGIAGGGVRDYGGFDDQTSAVACRVVRVGWCRGVVASAGPAAAAASVEAGDDQRGGLAHLRAGHRGQGVVLGSRLARAGRRWRRQPRPHKYSPGEGGRGPGVHDDQRRGLAPVRWTPRARPGAGGDLGQLGRRRRPGLCDKYSPVPVAGGPRVHDDQRGGDHTCALDTAGKAWCWGDDTTAGRSVTATAQPGRQALACAGGRGPGVHDDQRRGSRIRARWAPRGRPGAGASGGSGRSVTATQLRTTGTRRCGWPGTGCSRAISAGGGHTCALGTAGQGVVLGQGLAGQVGDGERDGDRSQYRRRCGWPGTGCSRRSAPGSSHTCALGTGGKAWCWGYDTSGQVGDGGTPTTRTPTYAPVRVAGDRVFKTISAGGQPHVRARHRGEGVVLGHSTRSGRSATATPTRTDKYQPVRVARRPGLASAVAGRLCCVPRSSPRSDTA